MKDYHHQNSPPPNSSSTFSLPYLNLMLHASQKLIQIHKITIQPSSLYHCIVCWIGTKSLEENWYPHLQGKRQRYRKTNTEHTEGRTKNIPQGLLIPTNLPTAPFPVLAFIPPFTVGSCFSSYCMYLPTCSVTSLKIISSYSPPWKH
jgi:hypothetical protein